MPIHLFTPPLIPPPITPFAAPHRPCLEASRHLPRCCTPPPPDSPKPTNWRTFRANLLHRHLDPTSPPPAQFAHLLPNPESGALLLAHPSYFSTSQRYFHHAVILIFSHTPEATAGLLLNKRPTEQDLPSSPWSDVPVNLGGDVGEGSMFAVYPSPKGAPGVLEGLSVGTVNDVMDLERECEVSRRDVRLFSRYCGWAPNQLQREVDSGVWYVASVAAELVLSEPETLYQTVMARLGVQVGGDGA